MTASKLLAAALLTSGLFVFSPAANAQDKPALTPGIVEQLDLASTLANYGLERRDPLLLLAAARLMKTITADSAPVAPAIGADELIEKAKEIAGSESDIEALADDIAAESSRGLCYGPGTVYGCF